MKNFISGIVLGTITWIVLAVMSATIYYAYGMIDVLANNFITWGLSITLFNIALDGFIIRKLYK